MSRVLQHYLLEDTTSTSITIALSCTRFVYEGGTESLVVEYHTHRV